jgi:hypothetical protein
MFRAIAVAAAVLFAAPAFAQKLGAYEGTATVAYKETSGKTRHAYEGKLKLRLPLTSANADSAEAELDGASSVGTLTITSYSDEQEATSKGADGKFMRVTCTLAAPLEVPVSASGNLSLDHRKKQYAMYIVLLPSKEFPVNCVNSQSGPYKGKKGVGVTLANFVPQGTYKTLPYSDPAHLAASYTLADPVLKDQAPIVQTWDLKLVK